MGAGPGIVVIISNCLTFAQLKYLYREKYSKSLTGIAGKVCTMKVVQLQYLLITNPTDPFLDTADHPVRTL